MKTLGEIAHYVGGRLRGDASIPIERVVHPALVRDNFDLALVFSPGAASILAAGQIANAVLPEEIDNRLTPNQIVVERPRLVWRSFWNSSSVRSTLLRAFIPARSLMRAQQSPKMYPSGHSAGSVPRVKSPSIADWSPM